MRLLILFALIAGVQAAKKSHDEASGCKVAIITQLENGTRWECKEFFREDKGCFTANTTLPDGRRLADLKVGDMVTDADGHLTTITDFTMNEERTVSVLDFYDEDGYPILSVTPQHVLFDRSRTQKFAKDFKVGDILYGDVSISAIMIRMDKIHLVTPLTKSGTIQVGSVITGLKVGASCYSHTQHTWILHAYAKFRTYDGSTHWIEKHIHEFAKLIGVAI